MPFAIDVAIIGAGPAGLIAAETLSAAGAGVTVYDRMPSAGRKFLMAGRGGLNLTHSEPFEQFLNRYGPAAKYLKPALRDFTPEHLRQWCENLGQPTFVGTSGRVFPRSLKASPLLRAWLARLEIQGVRFALKHQWTGWDLENNLIFIAPEGIEKRVKPDATLLALGGASWPRLGSDGGWTEIMKKENIATAPLRPANCGFTAPWSDIFRRRFAGQPLKSITLTFAGCTLPGEVMITERGLEGGLIYALSSSIRDAIEFSSEATLFLDLRPGLPLPELARRLEASRGRDSFSNYLRKTTGLSPAAIGVVYECGGGKEMTSGQLAALIKALPVRVTAPFSLDRSISTAGGISFDAVDDYFMLRKKPGVFIAGEMLDWEAPTGGYLLQACFSTGVCAAHGILTRIGN